ncbi:MAG: hypothetical protein ACOX61_04390 [Brooklawnia sp.]|jgi:protein-tyrosine phosphatase
MVKLRPLRVLFVCTANIARSPYAERRAAQLLTSPTVEVASAGIPGYPDEEMDTEMASILREQGGADAGHLSRRLTWEMIATADLVLTFELIQQMRVLDAWPDEEGKVLGLMQFADALERVGASGHSLADRPTRGPHPLVVEAARAAKPNSMTWDIADPYGRGAKAARKCAEEIDEVLQRIVPLLADPL